MFGSSGIRKRVAHASVFSQMPSLCVTSFEKPQWVELLPAEGPDSDAFDEELYHEYSNYHASPW